MLRGRARATRAGTRPASSRTGLVAPREVGEIRKPVRIGDVACGTAELQRILECLAAMLETPEHDEALERRALVREQRVGVADADPRGRRNAAGFRAGIMQARFDDRPSQ